MESQRVSEMRKAEGARVPTSTRFALDDRGQILGLFNVRHSLNERLERFGGHVGYSVRPSVRGRGHATALLQHAVELLLGLGVERMLITCDPQNVASARVIEKCGSVHQDTFFHEGQGHQVARYWIES